MKPKVYPCFRYHKNHPDGKKLHSEADWEALGGSGKGWVDSPAKIDHPHTVEEKAPPEPKAESEPVIGDELSSKSEDELRQMLMSQGVPRKALKGKTKDELVEMIEG